MKTGGPSFTTDEMCEITGLSARHVRRLGVEGVYPPPHRGKFAGVPTMTGWTKYLRGQLEKKIDEQKQELHALTRAKRMLAEEELAEFKGEYIVKSELGPALRNLGMNIRATLLRKYEQELAPKLAGKTTNEILDAIKAVNDDVIRVFHDSTHQWLDDPPL